MKLFIVLLIMSASAEFSVDWQLIERVIWEESRGIETAYNDGCYGLMQIHRRSHLDRLRELGCTEIMDTECNIRIGASILHDCAERYPSDNEIIKCYRRGW